MNSALTIAIGAGLAFLAFRELGKKFDPVDRAKAPLSPRYDAVIGGTLSLAGTGTETAPGGGGGGTAYVVDIAPSENPVDTSQISLENQYLTARSISL